MGTADMKNTATLLLLATLALITEAAVIKPELQDRQQLLNCFTTCVSTLEFIYNFQQAVNFFVYYESIFSKRQILPRRPAAPSALSSPSPAPATRSFLSYLSSTQSDNKKRQPAS